MKTITLTFNVPNNFVPGTDCGKNCPFSVFVEEPSESVWCADDKEYRTRPGRNYYTCGSHCGCIFSLSNEGRKAERNLRAAQLRAYKKERSDKCKNCIAENLDSELVGNIEVSKCTTCRTYYELHIDNTYIPEQNIDSVIKQCEEARENYIKKLKEDLV